MYVSIPYSRKSLVVTDDYDRFINRKSNLTERKFKEMLFMLVNFNILVSFGF